MAVKKMALHEWIEREGVNTIAKALNVTGACVRHWQRGRVLPTPRTEHRIALLSKGAVDFEKSRNWFFQKSNKKRICG